MKTFKKTYLPESIKYNKKTYVVGKETSKSIRVEVLSKDLIGVLDIHGKPYKPVSFYFNPSKTNCPCCNGEGFVESGHIEDFESCLTCNGRGSF